MTSDADKIVQMDPNQKRALADLAERPDRTEHRRTANHINITEQWMEPGDSSPRALARHFMAGQYISRGEFLKLKEMGLTNEEARNILREVKFDVLVGQGLPEDVAREMAEGEAGQAFAAMVGLETDEEVAARAVRESVVHSSETYNIIDDNLWRSGKAEGINYRRGEPIDWGG